MGAAISHLGGAGELKYENIDAVHKHVLSWVNIPDEKNDEPKEVIDELMPRPETPRDTENAQAITEREARDRLRRDKVILENQERRERGPKVGHIVVYNEVQKRLTSRLFLARGTEGEKNSYRKFHIMKYQNLS